MIVKPILQVYLTDDFAFNIKGTHYQVKKGTRVTIASGPLTVQRVFTISMILNPVLILTNFCE